MILRHGLFLMLSLSKNKFGSACIIPTDLSAYGGGGQAKCSLFTTPLGNNMIKIRKATHDDVKSITSLWCEFMDLHNNYDNYYKRAKNGSKVFSEFIKKQISEGNSLVLVGLINKVICAYLAAKIEYRPAVFSARKYGLISDIAVAEKYRRHGIGEKIYSEAIEWFKKRKIKRIELTVATSNPISIKFWSKLGFKPYSERRFIEVDN